MAITSTSNTAFVEAAIHSDFVLRNLHDSMLPTSLWRNVTDFTRGNQLDIPTIGSATLQDVSENIPLDYQAIDTGTVNLTITDYVGDAWYITDPMRQDGTNIEALLRARAEESTRAFAENMETRALAVINGGQTAGNANSVNGFQHRFNASGSNDNIELADIIAMRLSFDKANVPEGGRIGIVDPVVASTMERKFQGSYNVDANPTFMGVLTDGFSKNHRFVMHIFGFDIYTSNRLPTVTEALTHSDGTGSSTITGGTANIFMCVASDQTTPLMMAQRQAARTETERNKDRQRDEFLTTQRWGMGTQRKDTLGVIVTDPTATS
jgi:hypothetical protein